MKYKPGDRVLIVGGNYSFCRAARRLGQKLTGTVVKTVSVGGDSGRVVSVDVDGVRRPSLYSKNGWIFHKDDVRPIKSVVAVRFWSEP